MFEFKLPDLGEGIHEGEVLKWHVAEGERIAEDAPLVDIETDKAAVTIPAPKAGRVVKLNGKVGDVIMVGQIVAVIAAEGAAVATAPTAAPAPTPTAAAEPGRAAAPAPGPAGAPAASPVPGAPPAPAPLPAAPAPAAPSARGPVPAAPATRRLARELGVDLRLVAPTGPGGRVTPEDVRRFAQSGAPAAGVEAAAAQAAAAAAAAGGAARAPAGDSATALAAAIPAPHPAEAEFAARAASAIPFLDLEPLPDFAQFGPVEIEPLRSIRRKVARKMVTSMILVPHVAHMDEADVTDLEAFRKAENERRGGRGPKLTLLPFVVKAATAGLKQAASFNASLDPFKEEIVYKKYYNIGIAVDTGRGLIVPVVCCTDCKSITDIARDIEGLAARAREGKLAVEELRGGTFTITNVGPLGGTALIPTINYPEVAILGMGRVQEKPVVRDGQIVVRRMLPLTLAFDHRVADGADAARFVTEMIRHLADPHLLLLEA